MSVKICRAGSGHGVGRAGVDPFDVVFTPCAALGDYLVCVCAGRWAPSHADRGLAFELEFRNAPGASDKISGLDRF